MKSKALLAVVMVGAVGTVGCIAEQEDPDLGDEAVGDTEQAVYGGPTGCRYASAANAPYIAAGVSIQTSRIDVRTGKHRVLKQTPINCAAANVLSSRFVSSTEIEVQTVVARYADFRETLGRYLQDPNNPENPYVSCAACMKQYPYNPNLNGYEPPPSEIEDALGLPLSIANIGSIGAITNLKYTPGNATRSSFCPGVPMTVVVADPLFGGLQHGDGIWTDAFGALTNKKSVAWDNLSAALVPGNVDSTDHIVAATGIDNCP
jgi:hypothetical protein